MRKLLEILSLQWEGNSVKDFKYLKFLDLLKGIFSKLGIDYPIMRKILQIKLLLDSRRVATVLNNNTKKGLEEDKNNFIKSLWMYLIFGAFMVIFLFIPGNYLFTMSLIFSMFIFLMMTSLISDFSSVLLDLRDKQIILSKPVNNRTLNMAKLLHIFYYIFMITMALAGPSLVVSLFKQGLLFFLIYFIEVILIDLFVIILTALLYLFILRFFNGEKLKDIINYVQIFLTIFLSIGYQLMGRVFSFIDLKVSEFNPTWWKYLLPPLWFAAPFDLIINGNKAFYILIFSALALIIPIASIILYVKLIPTFERNLQKLNSADGRSKNKDKLTNLIAKIVCRNNEERAFFKFTTNMIRNERTFKLRVYPSLGFSIIFPFIMLFSRGSTRSFSEISASSGYFTLYFISFMIPSILGFISYSGNYKGAWIYKTTPIRNTSSIYKGAIKAVFINLFTPVYIFSSIIFLMIFKYKIVLDLIILYLNLLVLSTIVFRIQKPELPFSLAFEATEGKSGLGELLLSIMAFGILFGFHYGAKKILYGEYIYIIILLIANLFLWKFIFNIEKASNDALR